jgi:hypothetical protein
MKKYKFPPWKRCEGREPVIGYHCVYFLEHWKEADIIRWHEDNGFTDELKRFEVKPPPPPRFTFDPDREELNTDADAPVSSEAVDVSQAAKDAVAALSRLMALSEPCENPVCYEHPRHNFVAGRDFAALLRLIIEILRVRFPDGETLLRKIGRLGVLCEAFDKEWAEQCQKLT